MQASAGGTRLLGDTWYSDVVGGDRFLSQSRRGVVSGLRLFWRSRSYDAVVTTAGSGSVRVLALMLALSRRRALIILEFLPELEGGRRAALRRRFWGYVLRHAVLRAQVMTEWDARRLASRLRCPAERFAQISWPLRVAEVHQRPPVPRADRHGVLVSGRNSCDWPTVFEAAAGAGWELTVVCSADDLPGVQVLAEGSDVTVLSEIAPETHSALVAHAAVYALVLQEKQVSSGHVRLMNAVSSATPVVATEVRGLAEYLTSTAVVVTAGDAGQLRAAVQTLLDDPAQCEAVAQEALRVTEEDTWSRYTDRIVELVSDAAGGR